MGGSVPGGDRGEAEPIGEGDIVPLASWCPSRASSAVIFKKPKSLIMWRPGFLPTDHRRASLKGPDQRRRMEPLPSCGTKLGNLAAIEIHVERAGRPVASRHLRPERLFGQEGLEGTDGEPHELAEQLLRRDPGRVLDAIRPQEGKDTVFVGRAIRSPEAEHPLHGQWMVEDRATRRTVARPCPHVRQSFKSSACSAGAEETVP